MQKLRLVNPAQPQPGEDSIRQGLEDHRSHDLVIGIVSQVGAGGSKVATQLFDQLKAKSFGVQWLHLSQLLAHAAVNQDLAPANLKDLARVEKAEALQAAGDALRLRYGNSIVANLAIADISRRRAEGEMSEPVNVAILDSLKHAAEVEMLRSVYGNSFYLIGVVCGGEHRKERLQLKFNGSDPDVIERLATNDDLGESPHGQQVRKTLHLSDYFVNNEGKIIELANLVKRLVDVVTGADARGPTQDEQGMHAAYGAALQSACLSRQVGAAILDAEGKLLSIGRNDVPMAGGGLYGASSATDHRCYLRQKNGVQGYCSNDDQKNSLILDVFQQLSRAGLLSSGASETDIEAALGKTRVRDLIEFSRAVHAEMDAITAIARVGGGSTRGGTLYTTTYPCHNCARHIVAAGIDEVVYIEPYAKSLAVALHQDSVVETTAPGGVEGKVCFRLFTGVAPRRYDRLFEMRGARKDAKGHLLRTQPGTAQHRDAVLRKGFAELEAHVASNVKDLLGEDESA